MRYWRAFFVHGEYLSQSLTIYRKVHKNSKRKPGIVKGGIGIIRTKTCQRWVKEVQTQLSAQLQKYETPLFKSPIRVLLCFQKIKPISWPKNSTPSNPWPSLPWKRPDADNAEKLIFDAGTGLLWIDDSLIIEHTTIKRWSETPGVLIAVSPFNLPTCEVSTLFDNITTTNGELDVDDLDQEDREDNESSF